MLTYGSYLQLDKLLECQRPLGTDSDRGGEMFFIVAHQASELWLKSLLFELDALDQVAAAGCPPSHGPMLHARRALSCAEMLVAAMQALRALDADTFLRFRERLAHASGAQSAQFARLRRLTGVAQRNGGPLEATLRALAERHRVPWPDPSTGDGVRDEWYWFAEALRELSSALWRWTIVHLDVTQRLIGARPGTGGTSGVQFLAGRLLERPLPTLWRGGAAAADGAVELGAERCPLREGKVAAGSGDGG